MISASGGTEDAPASKSGFIRNPDFAAFLGDYIHLRQWIVHNRSDQIKALGVILGRDDAILALEFGYDARNITVCDAVINDRVRIGKLNKV